MKKLIFTICLFTFSTPSFAWVSKKPIVNVVVAVRNQTNLSWQNGLGSYCDPHMIERAENISPFGPSLNGRIVISLPQGETTSLTIQEFSGPACTVSVQSISSHQADIKLLSVNPQSKINCQLVFDEKTKLATIVLSER